MKKVRFFAALGAFLLTAVCLTAPFTASAQEGYPLEEGLTLAAPSAIVVYVDPSVSGKEALYWSK